MQPHFPLQKGFTANQCARVFNRLMKRLGHAQFYTQGGDWGSRITSTHAVLYPDRWVKLPRDTKTLH